jgi:hypothetical protein
MNHYRINWNFWCPRLDKFFLSKFKHFIQKSNIQNYFIVYKTFPLFPSLDLKTLNFHSSPWCYPISDSFIGVFTSIDCYLSLYGVEIEMRSCFNSEMFLIHSLATTWVPYNQLKMMTTNHYRPLEILSGKKKYLNKF